MNIQQLEYIIAVNRCRHYVTAAEQCGVTQPTLSTMIQRLEVELGVTIFDRSKQPIEPTAMGKKIIAQAEASLREMRKIGEMVDSEVKMLSGPLAIGIIPTLSPYLVPGFIHLFKPEYPAVSLSVSEMRTATLISALLKDEIDMFIAATPLNESNFLEIPLFYEKFVAYFSSESAIDVESLSANNMPQDNLWVLQEGHCFRNQIFNFCTTKISFEHTFEAGSIDTLIRVIDMNGGYSVIPELHKRFLSEEQQKNVIEIQSPPAVREISLIIKKDYVKERMLNAVVDTIKKIIPETMLDERLKKFAIRL